MHATLAQPRPARLPKVLTPADIGLSRRRLRKAYTGNECVRGDVLREVIPFAGRFFGVFGWRGLGSALEEFTLYQVVGGVAPTWQERRRRDGNGSLTDIDGLQVVSPDGSRWTIRQASAIHVRCERMPIRKSKCDR